MPIFFQQDINAATKLGVWEIKEDENFFLRKVAPQRNVSHPHKKLQHLAGRYLLQYLFPSFPVELIQLADTRKPFLKDEAYHFSISHCGNYAAAIVSQQNRVGIDIELTMDKIIKIQHKFLNEEEIKVVHSLQFTVHGRSGQQSTANDQLTLLWSCKEAVFKWYGLGEVNFKEHILIKKIKQISASELHADICFKKGDPINLLLCCRFFDGMVLSYVIT